MDIWGWVLKSRILAGRGWQLQRYFRSICLTSISFSRTLCACPVFHWLVRCITTLLSGSSMGKGELNNRHETWQPLLFFTEKAVSVSGARHIHNVIFVVCTRWQTLGCPATAPSYLTGICTAMLQNTPCSQSSPLYPGGSRCLIQFWKRKLRT